MGLVTDSGTIENLINHVNVFTLGWLDVDSIEDLDKSEEARNSGWDELVIPDKFSGLLLSLVSNHISGVSSRQWETSAKSGPTVQIDLVRGKGRGLIILLHGQYSNFVLSHFLLLILINILIALPCSGWHSTLVTLVSDWSKIWVTKTMPVFQSADTTIIQDHPDRERPARLKPLQHILVDRCTPSLAATLARTRKNSKRIWYNTLVSQRNGVACCFWMKQTCS